MKDYKPKVVLAKLQTGGKTVEQIRDELKGQGFTWNQFKHMKESYDLFDGLELYLSLWAYDGHSAWHLYNWKPEDDERVMNAIYHAEQFNPFPAYLKDYEKFVADWKAETYDPGCVFTLPLDAAEVLEVLQEEENDIDHEEVRKAINQAKEEGYQRRRRKRATKKSRNRHKRR